MKALTAAALLRASRGRFESWGVLQLGRNEMIALEFAFKHTKNIHLKELQANGSMGINRISKDMYEALRVGYKALEALPPNTDFSIKQDGTEHEAQAAPGQAQKTKPSVPEITSIPDWMKDMGISEQDINDTLNGDDTEGQK